MKHVRIYQIVVGAFFTAYFLLGVSIVRDYGLSWDEPYVRKTGIMAYRYVTGLDDELLRYVDRDYGTAIELPLIAIERWLNIESPQKVYYMRHTLTFLLFFTGTIFLYLLAVARFKHWAMALVGVGMLLCSPRIFADSFYNSKDIGLLSAFVIAVYTLTYYLKKPTWKRALVHGAVSAFVIAVRLPGLTIIGLTVGFSLLDTFFHQPRRPLGVSLRGLLVYIISVFGFVIAFWPYLWSDPIGHFLHALRSMSSYTFGGAVVRYTGRDMPVTDIPWHYPLVWVGTTTPFVFTVLFLAGAGSILQRCVRNIRHAYQQYRDDCIYIAWFVSPILAVILLGSPIYDGWRHLYFIYPAFVLVAVVGIERILQLSGKLSSIKRKSILVFLAFLLVVTIARVIYYMIRYHPYQHLYFNVLVGGMAEVKRNFVLDYWGLTYREGLTYIAGHDPRREITVYFDQGNTDTIHILPDKDRFRFIPLVSSGGADYILSTHLDDYSLPTAGTPKGYKASYNVIIDGVNVMTVFIKE